VQIGRARLATDSREPHGDRTFGALCEHVGDTEVREVVGTLEDTVRSTALGVNNTLGDPILSASYCVEVEDLPLSVKMREQINQVEVLQQEGSVETCTLDGVWVALGRAVGYGVLSRMSVAVPIIGHPDIPIPAVRHTMTTAHNSWTYTSVDFA
jgi:hypothetical protein